MQAFPSSPENAVISDSSKHVDLPVTFCFRERFPIDCIFLNVNFCWATVNMNCFRVILWQLYGSYLTFLIGITGWPPGDSFILAGQLENLRPSVAWRSAIGMFLVSMPSGSSIVHSMFYLWFRGQGTLRNLNWSPVSLRATSELLPFIPFDERLLVSWFPWHHPKRRPETVNSG